MEILEGLKSAKQVAWLNFVISGVEKTVSCYSSFVCASTWLPWLLLGNKWILSYAFVFCRQNWLKRNDCLECKIEQQAKNVGFTL